MAKLMVYSFKSWDGPSGTFITSSRMGTKAFIERIRATLIESSAVEIDESELEPGEEFTRIDYTATNVRDL
ncbi:MAG TPA: hypothetical protein VMF91_27490 [Bryobacteraceae bacterium]|nr:hypothetical protein [Bryobacteraceae bacterium]